MRQSPDPRVPLEVCLLRLTRRIGTDPAALLQRIEALEAEVAALRAVARMGRPPGTGPSRITRGRPLARRTASIRVDARQEATSSSCGRRER